MKILVLGAGAIGTYVGGSLAARGEEVSFVERPEVADVIGRRGLILHRGAYSRTERAIRVYTSDADALAAGPYDVCVFALKSFDTDAAVDELLATGHAVPPILSLQNGVDNEPAIAAKLGADGVIAGTVCSAIAKPGVGEIIEEKHRGIGIAAGHVAIQSPGLPLAAAAIVVVGLICQDASQPPSTTPASAPGCTRTPAP